MRVCVCVRDGLTHDVELGHAVLDVAAVPDHAAVAPRVVRPHVMDDQRAVGHHLEPGGRTERGELQGGPIRSTGGFSRACVQTSSSIEWRQLKWIHYIQGI